MFYTVLMFYDNLVTQFTRFSFPQRSIISTLVLGYHNLLTQLPELSFLQHTIISTFALCSLVDLHNYRSPSFYNIILSIQLCCFTMHGLHNYQNSLFYNTILSRQLCCATITCFHNFIQFIQAYLQKNENKLATPLTFTFPYEDDIPSLNNCKLGDSVYHIYHIEFEIKDTTDTPRTA